MSFNIQPQYNEQQMQRGGNDNNEIIKKMSREFEVKFEEFKKEFTESLMSQRINELELDNMINKYDFKKLQKENERLRSQVRMLVQEVSVLKPCIRKLFEERGEDIEEQNYEYSDEYWSNVQTLQQQLYELFNNDDEKGEKSSFSFFFFLIIHDNNPW